LAFAEPAASPKTPRSGRIYRNEHSHDGPSSLVEGADKGPVVRVGASWLGWTLDAFDFTMFLLITVPISQEFGVPLTEVAFLLSVT